MQGTCQTLRASGSRLQTVQILQELRMSQALFNPNTQGPDAAARPSGLVQIARAPGDPRP